MDKNKMMTGLAQEAYKKGIFNGTWLYAENGKIVSKGALGFRDTDNRLPMREDSVFELASITKQFTAAAVMLLVREGSLGLDDEVTEFYPQIPYPGVTIRHLLTHTGGVCETYDYNLITKIYQEEKRIPGSDIVVRFLEDTKPRFAPGESYEYTNGGYNLLAEIVAKAAGVPFEEYIKKNIFEPAGMYRTGIYHIQTEGVPHDNFVRNMVFQDGKFVPVSETEDKDVVAFDGLNGDDYVYTDIFDMFIWDRALREEKVLTLKEQMMMYAPGRLNDGGISGAGYETESYGFGWGIRHDAKLGLIVSHGGGMPGLNTWYLRCIDTDRMLVFLNCRDGGDVRGANDFWKGMQAIVKDEEPAPVKTIEDIAEDHKDRSKWGSFCGRYERPEDAGFAVDEVYMKDGKLYAKAFDEDDETEIRLYPVGEDEFGQKSDWRTLRFVENTVCYDDMTYRRISEPQ